MESNVNESVTQSEESGAGSEIAKAQVSTVSDAQLDYKRDMLRYKDELAATREELKEIKMEREQKNGNLEGVISTLKDEIRTLKHQNAQMKLNFADTQIESAVKQEALARGVKGSKLDVLMRVIDDNDKGSVELDNKFRASQDDVRSLVDKQMERYSDIFTKSVKVVDGVPSNNQSVNQPKKIDLSKMTAAQVKEYMLKNKEKLI